MVGKKQDFEFDGLSGLTLSEKHILEVLNGWDFKKEAATIFHLSAATALSESTVGKAIRRLKYLKKVGKSRTGSYFIIKENPI
jgi:hypothetical protein